MGISKARKEANSRYISKQDEFKIRLPQGSKEVIKKHVEATGESMNGFFARAVKATIAHDTEKHTISKEDISLQNNN